MCIRDSIKWCGSGVRHFANHAAEMYAGNMTLVLGAHLKKFCIQGHNVSLLRCATALVHLHFDFSKQLRTDKFTNVVKVPGVIGGLLGFGLIGIFVGPVVLAVTYTLLEAWIEDALGKAGAD